MTSLLLILATASGAMAAPYTSEALHQSAAGQIEGRPGIGVSPADRVTGFSTGYKMIDGVTNSTVDNAHMETLPVDLVVEYGLDARYTVGVGGEFQSTRTTYSKCNFNGCDADSNATVAHPALFFKGKGVMDMGSLQYGVSFRLNFTPGNNTASPVNTLDYGSSITPFVGYELGFSQSALGLRLAYTAALENQAAPGSSVDLYYEYGFNGFGLGLMGSATFFDSHRTAANETLSDRAQGLMATLYAPINISTVTVIPSVSYAYADGSDSAGEFERQSGVTFGASTRFNY